MQTTLTIWLDELHRLAPHQRDSTSSASSMSPPEVTLLDAMGDPIGAPTQLKVPEQVWLEYSTEDGSLRREAVILPLALQVPGIDGADQVLVTWGGNQITYSAAEIRINDARPPDGIRSFGAANGWTLLVVSEMFLDKEVFFSYCKRLYDFIIEQPPFHEPSVRNHFRLEALFWASSTSQFGTRLQSQGRIFGVNDLVRQYIAAARMEGRMSLVLINTPARGGAGGYGSDEPAWASVNAGSAEHWYGVALHELGHAFGLTDEYETEWPEFDQKQPLEPNVTKSRNAAHSSWAALCSPGKHDPTAAAGNTGAWPLDVVGTFEGARYEQTGFYRPSFGCLMRATTLINDATPAFCKVCQAHIRRVIAQV